MTRPFERIAKFPPAFNQMQYFNPKALTVVKDKIIIPKHIASLFFSQLKKGDSLKIFRCCRFRLGYKYFIIFASTLTVPFLGYRTIKRKKFASIDKLLYAFFIFPLVFKKYRNLINLSKSIKEISMDPQNLNQLTLKNALGQQIQVKTYNLMTFSGSVKDFSIADLSSKKIYYLNFYGATTANPDLTCLSLLGYNMKLGSK